MVEGHSFSVRPPVSSRATRSVVGRTFELEAISSAIDASLESVVAISLEGEPGIGKTTLLNAAADMARSREMLPVVAVADEEIRGPLLLARAIFRGDDLREGRTEDELATLERAQRAMRGEDEVGAGMPADEKMLRTFDLATSASRAVSRGRPLALLIDDMQWADQDSIRLLRYVIRSNSSDPLFIMLTLRPEETAKVTELVSLLADLERLAILRRLPVGRFRQTETGALLKNLLGGEPTLATTATIHAQAEGVPFIVEELTRAYRDAGLLQPIGGSWSLARHAERLVPSAVRNLIQRRAASLPPETRDMLATGAVLGRSFRVSDLCALRTRVSEQDRCEIGEALEALQPAIASGLLAEVGDGTNKYMTFSHEQVRAFALEGLPATRRRAMHAAVVDLLTADGDPGPEVLPVIVRQALAAGDTEKTARYSLDAARSALRTSAPDEALRLVEDALAIVSHPAQRVELLKVRDDALQSLGRSSDRLDSLSELTALAEAVGDQALEFDVQLRRAAALRADGRFDAAADIARKVRDKAANGDVADELSACLELGQDLLRSPLGEGYTPTPHESDLDGAEEAFERAAVLAEESGSEIAQAVVLRELGVIGLARVRAWFVELYQRGEHIPFVMRIADGETIEQISRELPIADLMAHTEQILTRSLELFEKLGDRRGAMSAIVSLAFLNWGPEIHLGTNPAQRFEGIRQLMSAQATLVQGSEREAAEAQMTYGVHVFARAKVIPDLAIERGEQTYERARAMGDRALEFLAAIGTTHAYLEIEDAEQAERWLTRAADCASSVPTPHRARQVATAGALLMALRGDAAGMRAGLERVVLMAAAQHRPAAQCQALALLAMTAARMGSDAHDDELLSAALSAAQEARRLAGELAGHPLWAAQADAAEAQVAFARGNNDEALTLARTALMARMNAMRDDPHLEILLSAARVVLALGEPTEKEQISMELHLIQGIGAQRIMDERVRVRWFQTRMGRDLAQLAGPFQPRKNEAAPEHALDDRDSALLRLLAQGRSNREIAEELKLDDAGVSGALNALYARIGTTTRAETTALAFRAV
jgi:DNA-binding NarL/FixJ family response regulator